MIRAENAKSIRFYVGALVLMGGVRAVLPVLFPGWEAEANVLIVGVLLAFLIRYIQSLHGQIRRARRSESYFRSLYASLHESEERFRQLTTHIQKVFWLFDPNGGQLLFVSPAVETVCGYKPADLLARPKSYFKDVHPEDQTLLLEAADRHRRGIESDIVFRLRRSGEEVWLRSRGFPIRNDAGELVRIGGFVEDITERRQIEEDRNRLLQQLEVEKRQLEQVLEQMPVGVLLARAEDREIVLANAQLKKMVPVPIQVSNDLDDYRWKTGSQKDGRSRNLEGWPLSRVLSHGEVVRDQKYTFNHPNGTRSYFKVNAAPIRDAEKKIRAGVVTVSDVTEELRRQEELHRAKSAADEASLSKSNFVANMSHEIRTPLGVILGFSEIALDPTQTDAERRGFLRSIHRNAQQLLRLVDEILDLSKVEADRLDVEKEPMDLPQMLEELNASLGFQASEKGIWLVIESDGEIPRVIVSDPMRLRQILMNVLGNAIKFTERGQVKMTVRAFPERIEPTLEFTVEDTGIGLTRDHQQRLFQPFTQADSSTTRRFGGTGLGLVLSRKLAELLGGRLDLVESRLGKGSTFRISIPVVMRGLERIGSMGFVVPIHDGHLAVAGTVPPAALVGRSVLLVEDSPDNQTLITRYLRKAGLVVDTADNGFEGAERAMQQDYGLVLMDIQMPLVDGYEATRRLREGGYQKPIIALTAHAMKGEREKALRSGFDAYLTKPVNRVLLLETIQRFLDGDIVRVAELSGVVDERTQEAIRGLGADR